MRVSEAGLALFQRPGPDGTEYLTQWSDTWQSYALIGGHVEPGESFRACCVREIAEELELTPDVDFRVGVDPLRPLCEYTALSKSAGVESRYRVELYAAELLTRAAETQVNANAANRWLTEVEIRRHVSADGKEISIQVETVLTLCGIIHPKHEHRPPDPREAIMSAHRQLFLFTVSSEFQSYRELLAGDLKRPNLDVKVQEDFVTTGGHTLGKLDEYIRHCDAVIHLIGKATGSVPEEAAVAALLKKYPDMPAKLPPLAALLKKPQPGFSYTQWEAYLGNYHERHVYIYRPTDKAPRDADFKLDPIQEQSQEQHYKRICDLGRDRGQFANQERLSSAVLRDLVEILPALESTVEVAPTRLHQAAEQLIGREPDLARLDQAWANEHKHVVVIRAWGGVGKTSLVADWMAEMALKDWRGARRVFDWTFYSQGTRSGVASR